MLSDGSSSQVRGVNCWAGKGMRLNISQGSSLAFPFQTDDGELAQGNEQLPGTAGYHQRFVKQLTDGIGDDGRDSFAAARFPDPGGKHHGVQNFHHGSGEVMIEGDRGGVIAAVGVGAGVFTAEDGTLVEDRKTIEGGRAVGAYRRVGQNAVVEGQIDAVVAAVKGYGFYVNGGGDQLGAADTCVSGGVQDGLGAGGQINAQVLDAVFIPAGVGDFTGMDGHGLAQIPWIAAQGVLNVL